MNILVADDHTLIREGLRKIISERADWTVIADASSADEVLSVLRHHPIDVLVLDISLGGRSGLDLLGSIRSEFPAVRTLILSMHDERHYALRALRSGAAGYIQKDASATDVRSAIGRVSTGHTYLSETIGDDLVSTLVSSGTGLPHERLTAREFEVFRLIGTGRSVGDVAAVLHLSPKTVSTYRTRILEKTGFGSNAEIISYAVRSGIV